MAGSSSNWWRNAGEEYYNQDDIQGSYQITYGNYEPTYNDNEVSMGEEQPIYGNLRAFDSGYDVEIPSSSDGANMGVLTTPPHTSDEDDGNEILSLPTAAESEIYLGKRYATVSELKEEIRKNALENGYGVRFLKSGSQRLTAVCVDDCPWRIHASKMHDEETIQIKTFVDSHNCARRLENHLASAKWLANAYVDRFRSQPDWSIPSIIETVKKDYNITISSHVAINGRKKACKLNEGFGEEQFQFLRQYGHELMRSNPGTRVGIDAQLLYGTGEDAVCEFKRFYVCPVACRRAIVEYARPVICLDGCHLKGACPGHLLTAVGVDSNDGLYVVAYAVVESECGASWRWFLNQLRDDLDTSQGGGWTVISDRQKGLVNAVHELFPNAHHRFCLRHLYANMKQTYRGKIYKDFLWNAANATTESDFERVMARLNRHNPLAADYLRVIPVEFWAAHAFSMDPKCGMGLNNLSESFNKIILSARDKPIITMLEMIRKSIMMRIVRRREQMVRSNDVLCTRIRRKLNQLISESRDWNPVFAGNDMFEVSNGRRQYIVNMRNATCNCRYWGLMGIPCAHAIPCMQFMRFEIDSYVHRFYHRQTYINMYSHYIAPIADREMWPEVRGCGQLIPPPIRRKPGRPKKKRTKDVDEPQRASTSLSRKIGSVHCGACGMLGHNKKTCAGRASTSGARRSEADEELFMGFNVPTQESQTHGDPAPMPAPDQNPAPTRRLPRWASWLSKR